MASMTLAARAACPNPWGEIKKAILLGGESGSYRVVIDEVLWVRVQNDAVLDQKIFYCLITKWARLFLAQASSSAPGSSGRSSP
jgi:hypothetical protein